MHQSHMARFRACLVTVGLIAATLSGCASAGLTPPPAEIAANREVLQVDESTLKITVNQDVRRNAVVSLQMVDDIFPNVAAALLLAAADETRKRGHERFALFMQEPETDGAIWYHGSNAHKVRLSVTREAIVILDAYDPDATWTGTTAEAESFAQELATK